MARLLERMIRSEWEEVAVIKAYEPEELLRLVTTHRPSVVLVDVVLLEDAVETNLERLRKACGSPGAVIVGTSDRAYVDSLATSPKRCFYLVTTESLQPVATVRQMRRLLTALEPESN